MTEEEAKTKRCVRSRARRVWSWKHFRFLTEHGGCLASRCMAWRWLPNASGYCGLAGAPDWDAPEAELPK